MNLKLQGSVRVDLLGGTLDLDPISLIIPKVVTLNLATTLMADVEIKLSSSDILKRGVELISNDYNLTIFLTPEDLQELQEGEIQFLKSKYDNMLFPSLIVSSFSYRQDIQIRMETKIPTGSGLGTSSALGVTLYKALNEFYFKSKELPPNERIIKIVKSYESKILNAGPAGYQDYYPALYGGILALTPSPTGVDVKQLYEEDLKKILEKHLTLIYSGNTRHSGINNWEVYKGFFDKDENIIKGLKSIAELSALSLLDVEQKKYNSFLEKIAQEGEERKRLFSGIEPQSVSLFYNEVKELFQNKLIGKKMCGAGGGGCFLLIHDEHVKNHSDLKKLIVKYGMQEFPLNIASPIL